MSASFSSHLNSTLVAATSSLTPLCHRTCTGEKKKKEQNTKGDIEHAGQVQEVRQRKDHHFQVFF